MNRFRDTGTAGWLADHVAYFVFGVILVVW